MIHISDLIYKRRPTNESGFALITAIIMLVIITALTGSAITVAVQSSTSTERDSNVKAELAAAEAGLQVASYRLTQLKPAETQCINEREAVTSSCTDSPESLGNGAAFHYWTSLPLTAGTKCAGRTVEIIAKTTQRCVTSEGTVNGATPGVRLQARVTAGSGKSLFGVKGVVGLSEVLVTGSVQVPGVVASNGKIIGEGSANFVQGFELCPPNGTFEPAVGKPRKQSGVKIAGKNPEAVPALEKTRSAGPPECLIEAPLPTNHATAATNEDGRIGTTDPLEGTNTWTPATHELTLGANGVLTLAGSQYYLCNFIATNNSTLRIAATAKVEIFIDSVKDGCKAGTGKFEAGGSFVVENLAHNPAALLIVMAGAGPFAFENGKKSCAPNACLEASVYAPEANVTMNGGTTFKGGIVGNKVHLQAGAGIFEWSEESGALTDGTPTGYDRKAWAQCTPGGGSSEAC